MEVTVFATVTVVVMVVVVMSVTMTMTVTVSVSVTVMVVVVTSSVEDDSVGTCCSVAHYYWLVDYYDLFPLLFTDIGCEDLIRALQILDVFGWINLPKSPAVILKNAMHTSLSLFCMCELSNHYNS